jgi:hypothetical protein
VTFSRELRAYQRAEDSGATFVSEFEFSCVDPDLTRRQLLKHIEQFPGENVVICPLNTKLSTVGAVLAALDNPEIQICYSQPLEYNSAGYSSPGPDITLIEMAGIWQPEK